MLKIVPYFIAFCFIAILASWCLLGYAAVSGYQGYQTIKKDGLKTIATEIWEGQNPSTNSQPN